jgi:hypothetical protein
MAKAVDIEALVRKMLTTDPAGPGDLAVWGGEFGSQALEAFLKAWNLPRPGMPWSIWQWTDDIDIGHDAALPGELGYLERGRVFGEQGDLELRREGDQVLWRFVGPTSDPDPVPDDVKTADYGAVNYWGENAERDPDADPATIDEGQAVNYCRENAGRGLRPYERTALLWGADDNGDGRWRDPRVGRARLEYPTMKGHQVVQVRYVEYLHGGDVEFARLLGLEPGPDRPKGGNNA